MRTNKFIKKCGPYEVHSISQDMHGIRLEIYPAFPEYNLTDKERSHKETDAEWIKEPRWPIHRYKGNGGGPGIFTCIALAKELEEFLNQPYTPEQIREWKNTNAQALKNIRESKTKIGDPLERYEGTISNFITSLRQVVNEISGKVMPAISKLHDALLEAQRHRLIETLKEIERTKREYPYIYTWGNNPKRQMLKGRRCSILQRLALNSAIIKFEDGQLEVISRNALRKG
jgi:hypothetical protein